MTASPGPFSNHVLLVAPFDRAGHAHSALRARALERLGCTVRRLSVVRRKRWWRLGRRRALVSRVARELDRAAFDLVLVVGPRAFPAEDVDRLRGEGSTRWVWWSPDGAPSDARLGDTVRAYDHVFVGATDVATRLRHEAERPVGYLPPACDPSFHRPLRARDRFRANVVFAGRASARREELLAAVVEFGLAVWGPGWRRTRLREYCRGEQLTDQDYLRAYAGASVALNIHRDGVMPECRDGCNPRVFELAAMSAAQVVDRRADLALHFQDGRHLQAFGDSAELRHHIRRLLHDPPAAEDLGLEAHRAALAGHTYMHRMIELLKAVSAG